jgi:hypothetical protein
MNRRLRFRLQGRRRRASVGHGVVSTGAPTPGLIGVSPPGDYAIVNSNHIPDGTAVNFADIHFGQEHFTPNGIILVLCSNQSPTDPGGIIPPAGDAALS